MESSQMISNTPRRLIRVTRKVIVKSTSDQATTSYAYSNQRFRVISSQQGHNRLWSQPQYVVYSSYPEQQFVPYTNPPMDPVRICYVYSSAPKRIIRKVEQRQVLANDSRRDVDKSDGLQNELGSPPVLVPESRFPKEMKLDAVCFDRSLYFTENQENIAPLRPSVDEKSLSEREKEIKENVEEPKSQFSNKPSTGHHPNAPDMAALFDQIPLGKTIGHSWTDLLQFLRDEGFYKSDASNSTL